MNTRNTPPFGGWSRLGALLTLPLLAAAVLPAQIAPTGQNDGKEETVKLEKFVVTGSLIPIAADSPAVPITVLSSSDIAKSGVNSDLLEVLKKTEPYFYGANNVGSENGNIQSGSTNGGSTASLRNRATLVLVNGRRANVAPVVASGGRNFVDVSLIPIAAVERIEILTDGASATYGSDAVSGVVNVILKSNFSGIELAGRYGWSPNDGNYSERSYSAVFGASTEKTNITVSTEWKKSDPIIQVERPFSQNLFLTATFAGVVNQGNDFYYLNPSLNAPPLNQDLTAAQLVANGTYQGPFGQAAVLGFFDTAFIPTLVLEAQRRSVVAAIDHQLTENVKLFGDLLYTVNRTQSILNAQPLPVAVAASSPANPFNVTVTARNRFFAFPRIFDTESAGLRGVVGVKGSIGGKWNYELAGNFNRTVSKYFNHNLIDAAAYNAALAAGTLNPFARIQAPGIVETLLGTSFRDYTSELNGVDLRVSGEIWDLPAGAIQMGFGAETRSESLKFVNDRFEQTGAWLGATPRLPFSARSNTDGLFAEIRVPIFGQGSEINGARMLEVSFAGRKDIYSDTTDPFVPKYTVRWLPFNDEFAVRGTYSESFTAPTLFELLGPITIGFTNSINIARFDTNGNALGVNTGARQYRSRGGANPNLQPSQSRNWTAGFVWSPKRFKSLEVSVDWFNIDERDLIAGIGATTITSSVERLGPASPYASAVRLGTSLAGETHFDDGAPITTPGQITNRPSDEVWISTADTNLAGVWQAGADIRVGYTWDTGNFGKIRATLVALYLHEYVTQTLPTDAPSNFVDGFSGTSTYARYRTNTRLNWSHKNWDANLAHTFIPSVDDLAFATEYASDSYQAFDFSLGHTFANSENKWLDGLSFSVGVNNVFNEEPPFLGSEGNQQRDIRTYDPIGRFVWMSARYKF